MFETQFCRKHTAHMEMPGSVRWLPSFMPTIIETLRVTNREAGDSEGDGGSSISSEVVILFQQKHLISSIL